MQIVISIDDTDNLDSRGTGEIASHIADALTEKGWGSASTGTTASGQFMVVMQKVVPGITFATTGIQGTGQVLVEGDEVLLNRISLIPVNPKKFPAVHHVEALQFVAWLTDPAKGQRLIAEFGKEKYGAPLFFPDSRQWHARPANLPD